MQTVVSFSQDYEDIILYHLLEKVTEPIFYVDVGANDPVFISVTKFFYERGASGINIEPQHDFIEKLNADRPKDLNLEIGVGNEPGILKLYGEGTGASFDADLENASVCREVAIRTLAEVFKKYVSNKTTVHFLKVDVENFERQVLEGMDFASYRPWIVCMESTLPGTSTPSWDAWEHILLSQNYEFLGMSGINRYYAAVEVKHLLNDFCDAEKLKTLYNIIVFYKVMQKAADYEQHEVVYKSKITNILKHIYGTK